MLLFDVRSLSKHDGYGKPLHTTLDRAATDRAKLPLQPSLEMPATVNGVNGVNPIDSLTDDDPEVDGSLVRVEAACLSSINALDMQQWMCHWLAEQLQAEQPQRCDAVSTNDRRIRERR